MTKQVEGAAMVFWQNGAILQILRKIALKNGVSQRELDDIHKIMMGHLDNELQGNY